MQRNFGAMQKQVEAWRETELSNVAAKMIVYEVSIEDGDSSLQDNPGEGMPGNWSVAGDLQAMHQRFVRAGDMRGVPWNELDAAS
jgi:hypothetical protein